MENAAQAFGSGLNYFQALLAIEFRNLEAIQQAQKKMFEGMGVLVQRQAEMTESAFRRSFGTPPSVPTSVSAVHAAVVGQIDSLKATMLEGQASSNILSELAARSSGDVANILQSRMLEALDEFKSALVQAVPEKLDTVSPLALTAQPAAQA